MLEAGMDLAEKHTMYGGPGFLGEYKSAKFSILFEVYKKSLSALVTAKCSFHYTKKWTEDKLCHASVSSNLYFFRSLEGMKQF